ncbi:uncharacterized protein LOC122291913 [Carya illinoinensis]|uniref:uncharacterized protein LOC122291913 n=1 Tax=Carya illinoinensis TaxID=32201 RepID=UPI001C720A5E|nr:uncharacterized protein LOC122291913 [Carya illinoinensis]
MKIVAYRPFGQSLILKKQCFEGIERMLLEIQIAITGIHVGGDKNQDNEGANHPRGGRSFMHRQRDQADNSSSNEELEGFVRGNQDGKRASCNNHNFRIKFDLPCFNGHLHGEIFLDWMLEVEKFFYYMQIPQAQQVKLVAYKLSGGASVWWEQMQNNRRRQGKQPVCIWPKMKRLMRA